MKILFFSHAPHLMGANRSLLSLVEGLIEKGVVVEVWCNEKGGFSNVLEQKSISHKVFPFYNWAATFLHSSFWLLPYHAYRNHILMQSLIEEAKLFGPNIIHSNTSVFGVGAQLAEALDKPHVWHIREFAKAHYDKRFYPSDKIFYNYLGKADKAIAISHAIKDGIVKGEQDVNWEVVYNGVLADDRVYSPKKEGREQAFRFLSVGMLHPSKGQLEAIQAFGQLVKKYPNCRLVIVGMGQRLYTQRLKYWIRRLGLSEKVELKGYVSNLEEIYQSSDAMVFCSRKEGMGRVTVEAMANALPVIGYADGATPELIEDGVDGLLYSDGVEDLVNCMERLLANPSLCEQMGRLGQEKVKERFRIQQYVDNMYEVFREVYPF